MTLLGIDVSHWQVATPPLAGLSFVLVKATHGTATDPGWSGHAANVRTAGLVLGAYHYGDPHQSVTDQAAAFLRVGGSADLLALDVEAGNMTESQASAFLAAVQAQGRKVGLYHSASGFPQLGQDWDWVASWTATPPPRYDIWQYRGNPLDLDRFEGTRAELLGLGGPTMKAITDETPAEITVAKGAAWYDLDGVTRVLEGSPALDWRKSPYAAGGFRAMYATVEGARRLVLVHASGVRPVVDCAQPIADAITADRAKAKVTWGP